jgi:hypothetical protein
MPEDVQAESSPAEEQTPQTESKPESKAELKTDPLKWTGDERSEWLKSGKIPVAKPKKEASAPSKQNLSEPAKKADESDAPESEPGEDQQERTEVRKPSAAERRIKQLLAKTKQLEEQIASERRGHGKEEKAAEPQQGKKAEGSTELRPCPKIDDKKPEGGAKYSDFDEYLQDLAKWSKEEAVAEFKRDQAETNKKTAEEAEFKGKQEKWAKGVEEFAKDHADFQELTFDDADFMDKIPAGSSVDRFILESDSGPALLYHLAQNPDEIKRILRISGTPLQYAELGAIASGLNGKSSKPPAKKLTSAPPPVSEVGGKGTAAGDPIESAVKRGDFASYFKAQNAKELKARKG